MLGQHNINKIAFVGNYLPRQCGIATFTYDLYNSISEQHLYAGRFVVAISDRDKKFDYPPEVRFEIIKQDIDTYRKAADFLNYNNVDVVSVQHEFGIFGGNAGSHVLALIRDLKMPVVTTLHTILSEPSVEQRRVMEELIAYSSRLVTMTEKGKKFLEEIYNVPVDKIDLIPHGIPDMPFVDPNFYKDRFGVEGKYVLLTFGLLSPGKGIEYVLKALPKVISKFPNLVYIILGATHPNIIKEQGESYRMSLERLAYDLGIKNHVIFYNRFVDAEELKEFIGAADIYITPYLNKNQITSGTLSYSFGCGKAVISTPYWHAEELLADNRGILVPFADDEAIASEIIKLLEDEPLRHSIRKRAYMLGREMVWSNIAHYYLNSFQKARRQRAIKSNGYFPVKTLSEKRMELPSFNFNHLINLSDSTGIFQHAYYTFPRFEDGYCLDDNSRAYLLTVLLDELGIADEQIYRLASSYASFINFAYNPDKKRFRNFMDFSRKWLEEIGSDDAQGRTIWALGASVGRSTKNYFKVWAHQLFNESINSITELTSPRAWAFALLGINDYLNKMSGDRLVLNIREILVDKLVTLYKNCADENWKWFENILAYDNARLSQALILSGHAMNNSETKNIGLESLRWLMEIQTREKGYLRPIGSEGWYTKNGKKANFDQQPVSAYDAVSACADAYRITGDEYWYNMAKTSFEWFLGRNDLGLPLYDPNSGGCYDALHVDRINLNQGAESTLSFLLSLTEIYRIENMIKTFESINSFHK
ncbi:glycosyltransferase family 4 protein [Melioribacter sp. OK-6-Me]|uniref:glycosyltransferase family 4 protein n=1 Tax=unclassified Melioribacter TaxID=2627329 RepID=UPI003ED9E448